MSRRFGKVNMRGATILCAACMLVAASGSLRADTESFESYAPGSNIYGQGTWGGYLAENDTATVINTDAAPGQGTQSLEYDDNTQYDTSQLTWGVSNTPFDGSSISLYYKAVGAYSAFYVEPQLDISGSPATNNSGYVFGFGDSGGYVALQGGSGVALLQDSQGNYFHYVPNDWYRIDLVNHETAGNVTVDVTLTDATTNDVLISETGLGGYSVGGRDTLDELDFYNSSDTGQITHLDGLTINPPAAGAAQWVLNGSGDWNIGSHWSSGTVPNGVDAAASLLEAITSNNTIYTNSPITVGTLTFGNANMYEVTGTGSLTLQTSTGSAQVNVQMGTQEINLPTTIASNTIFNVSSGATLIIGNPLTINAGQSITQTGSGTVNYESTVTVLAGGSFAVANSTHAHALTLQSNSQASISGQNTVLQLDSLSIGTSAKLDVEKDEAVVNYSGASPASSVFDLIQSAYNHGAWTGSGITSSAAVSTAGTAVGYLDTGTQIEIKFTWYGDLDLSGAIDNSDVQSMLNGNGSGWSQGDLNYDGTKNADDYSLFNLGVAMAGGRNINSVPEPGIALAMLPMIGFIGRRRRK